jgi:hypothetical protein
MAVEFMCPPGYGPGLPLAGAGQRHPDFAARRSGVSVPFRRCAHPCCTHGENCTRPQRCDGNRSYHADGLVQGGARQGYRQPLGQGALLAGRALLVKIKRDLENHVRGLLKNLGLVIGRAKFNVFAVRCEELIEGHPELIAAIRPLLEARNAVEQQVTAERVRYAAASPRS